MAKNQTPDGEPEAALLRYAESASTSARAQAASAARIIETVRDYLAASPAEPEGRGSLQNTAVDEQRALMMLGKLARNSTALGQMQAVSLLAALIRWFSVESGRTEEEILARLEAPFLESTNESLSIIREVTQRFRNIEHGDKG